MTIPEWLYWWMVGSMAFQAVFSWVKIKRPRMARFEDGALWLGLLLAFGSSAV